MVWFTADQHLSHESIIGYCNRPFKSIEDMNSTLIDNWNKVVQPSDAVYLLGDFAWRHHELHAAKLNGNIYLIRGNHDYRSDTFYRTKCKFRSVTKRSDVSIEGEHMVLDHYSLRVWNRSHYNAWNLYAHSHGKLPPIGKAYDVGVDNNNYTPVSFNRIKEIMDSSPDNFNFIHPDKRNNAVRRTELA